MDVLEDLRMLLLNFSFTIIYIIHTDIIHNVSLFHNVIKLIHIASFLKNQLNCLKDFFFF